jgi:hypothetical protein
VLVNAPLAVDAMTGENVQVVCVGRFEQDSVTCSLKPFSGVIVTAEVPVPPGDTVRLEGFTVTLKSGTPEASDTTSATGEMEPAVSLVVLAG